MTNTADVQTPNEDAKLPQPSRRSRELDRALTMALEDGDADLVQDLHPRRVEADSELAALVMAHRGKGTPN